MHFCTDIEHRPVCLISGSQVATVVCVLLAGIKILQTCTVAPSVARRVVNLGNTIQLLILILFIKIEI